MPKIFRLCKNIAATQALFSTRSSTKWRIFRSSKTIFV